VANPKWSANLPATIVIACCTWVLAPGSRWSDGSDPPRPRLYPLEQSGHDATLKPAGKPN
jgi:hypothetical protein